MTEPTRPVAREVSLIDIDVEMPSLGSNVLAIGLGGKLAEIVWSRDSPEFFVAWMAYPRIPTGVKEKLYNIYTGRVKV